MRIIFVKDYVDTETYENPVFVSMAEEAILIDESSSKIELKDGTILEYVNQSVYAFIKGEKCL